MKAAQFESFGEPADVLRCVDRPEPTPGGGEVRVRMLASPINPSDLMTVRGEYGSLPDPPAVPGYEGVGVVESGGGLLGLALRGKRVAVLNGAGGNWAEFVTLPANRCVPLPADLSLPQAAMFFVNPATAYLLTAKVLAVPRGAWLLQTAAGSSLGQMVIRLGVHRGFRTVNVVRRAEQAETLRGLGADAVVVFDEKTEAPADLAAKVREATGGADVRHAIDPVAGATGGAAVGCLAGGGRLISFGTLSGEPLAVPARHLLFHQLSVEGFYLGKWMDAASLPTKLRVMRTVGKLLSTGVIANDVGESFPLDRVAEAVAEAEKPGRGGKAWLTIGE
ncbi:zinc-dependent alcohol dehydrogenase family protein [Alienimonas sp. DA493]|uniref:zinc-dependent alcohol dehydrogenase family protein n=1 Tax=Alienimonas sp. DA493 TaxID=3373605 RepID=UPI003753E89B